LRVNQCGCVLIVSLTTQVKMTSAHHVALRVVSILIVLVVVRFVSLLRMKKMNKKEEISKEAADLFKGLLPNVKPVKVRKRYQSRDNSYGPLREYNGHCPKDRD